MSGVSAPTTATRGAPFSSHAPRDEPRVAFDRQRERVQLRKRRRAVLQLIERHREGKVERELGDGLDVVAQQRPHDDLHAARACVLERGEHAVFAMRDHDEAVRVAGGTGCREESGPHGFGRAREGFHIERQDQRNGYARP
jgi:hypothetical protein